MVTLFLLKMPSKRPNDWIIFLRPYRKEMSNLLKSIHPPAGKRKMDMPAWKSYIHNLAKVYEAKKAGGVKIAPLLKKRLQKRIKQARFSKRK